MSNPWSVVGVSRKPGGISRGIRNSPFVSLRELFPGFMFGKTSGFPERGVSLVFLRLSPLIDLVQASVFDLAGELLMAGLQHGSLGLFLLGGYNIIRKYFARAEAGGKNKDRSGNYEFKLHSIILHRVADELKIRFTWDQTLDSLS